MTDDPSILFTSLGAGESMRWLAALARAEDLGDRGDVTTESLDGAAAPTRARVVTRSAGVVAGLAAIPALREGFESATTWTSSIADAARVEAATVIGHLAGPRRDVLALERTLLNVLGHLGGIATATARYVDAVAGTGAAICATRKTLPGWRALQKYAVACGGGVPHRFGLHDAALYKDNHLAGVPASRLAAALGEAIGRARAGGPLSFVEVEVDELEQLRAVLAMDAGVVDLVLLDNMPPATLRDAVALRDATHPGIRLEASGGITLDTVRIVAETGVDRISVGAITHSAAALDVALEVEP